MPKTKRASVFFARLRKEQDERFRELAHKKQLTYTELLREAVDFYLEQQDQDRLNELEGIYAKQLQLCSEMLLEEVHKRADLIDESIAKGIERVCKMSAKDMTLSGAAYYFLQECDPERMRESGLKAKQLVSGKRKIAEDAPVTELHPQQPVQAIV